MPYKVPATAYSTNTRVDCIYRTFDYEVPDPTTVAQDFELIIGRSRQANVLRIVKRIIVIAPSHDSAPQAFKGINPKSGLWYGGATGEIWLNGQVYSLGLLGHETGHAHNEGTWEQQANAFSWAYAYPYNGSPAYTAPGSTLFLPWLGGAS